MFRPILRAGGRRAVLGASLRRASDKNTGYPYKDPFNIESRLTEEEIAVRDVVRKYCQEKLLPGVTEHYRAGTLPKTIFKELAELGVMGPTIQGYGCAGTTYVATGLIARELERVDSGYRSAWSVTSSLVMHPINTFGTAEQKEKYLPRLAAGEIVGAFGLTEPSAGSDPGSMRTRFEDKGSHYLLNGSKMWITNSPLADVFIIWAKGAANGELKGFIVERDFGGVTTPKIEGKLSLRASITGEIVLDNVKVPKENILNVTGFRGPFSCLNSARFGIGWGVWGAAEFCFEAAREYALQRIQFGRPLAATQLVQTKLANMHVEIQLGLSSCYLAGRLKDEGNLTVEATSILKRNGTGKSLEIARAARDVFGGNGIVDDYHVMRHMCNLETVHTYEGTYDIHGLILGRAITGLAAF